MLSYGIRVTFLVHLVILRRIAFCYLSQRQAKYHEQISHVGVGAGDVFWRQCSAWLAKVWKWQNSWVALSVLRRCATRHFQDGGRRIVLRQDDLPDGVRSVLQRQRIRHDQGTILLRRSAIRSEGRTVLQRTSADEIWR